MERLTPLSYAFLAAEDVDPAACLVIGSMAVLDGPAPAVEEVRDVVAARLPSVPRYRERLSPSLLGLRPPGWVEATDLDLTRHVRAAVVPPPGGPAELAELTADLMARRMDRRQPLWDVTVCEGLDHGRWGLLSRVHHALADGVSGAGLHRIVLDSEAPATEPPPTPPRAAPGLSPTGVVSTAIASVRGALTLGTALWPARGEGLLGHLDGQRCYAWTSMSIGASAPARHDLGVTLNDLVLAAITGGLREFLLHRGRQPDQHAVRSLLPVSSRRPGTADRPGNQVTLMLPELPVEVDDPVDRVRAVHQRVSGLRRSHEPEAGVALQAAAGLLPFPLLRWGVRWGLRFPQQQIVTVTTNVPGPRAPLTCVGRPVQELLPVVPIADRVRIGFAVMSYVDTLTVGITADASAAADIDVLAAGVGASWQAVLDARPAWRAGG